MVRFVCAGRVLGCGKGEMRGVEPLLQSMVVRGQRVVIRKTSSEH